MNKEEALKNYSDGLEKSLNHPVLLKDRTLKDMMKFLCLTSFEHGWDLSTFDTISQEDRDKMLAKWKEVREKVKTYEGFMSVLPQNK